MDRLAPLADRMRPRTLAEFIGQEQIVGEGKLLRRAIEADRLTSSIFWGPPGTGKTTLASIIAETTRAAFVKLNAVTSGVADVREVLKAAEERLKLYGQTTYLLLDECHRWSKAQSDSILPAIERGVIRFIGSTTENPMIAMTPAIVSRCRLFRFEALKLEDVKRAVVDGDTFFDGVFVEGVDVSAMSLEEALTYWEENIEPVHAARTVVLSDGTKIVASDVGYTSNYRQVLQTAYDACRTGSLDDQFQTLGNMGAGKDYAVSRTYCTREALEGVALNVALSTDHLPIDAKPVDFDADTRMFVFGEPTDGQTLDREALYKDVEASFAQGGGEVELQFVYTEAEVPVDRYGLIASYTTDASTSSSARIHNIRLALETINGTCLEPGEVFSFNGVVGERTEETGYRPAPAYSRMQTVMEYGGGICQVSSTLYAAVAQTGLEIVERHSHSLNVNYIPRGMDATVDWGNKDFKFANNTDEPIYIVGYVDGFEQVYIGLYGRL